MHTFTYYQLKPPSRAYRTHMDDGRNVIKGCLFALKVFINVRMVPNRLLQRSLELSRRPLLSRNIIIFEFCVGKEKFFYEEVGERVITVTVVFMLCAHVMTCEVICFCMALKT